MPKSSENLRKFTEEHGNLWEFPKTSETLHSRFWELKRFKKMFWKIFGNVHKFLEKFGDGPKWFLNVRKMFEDLRKCSENLFKSNFQKFLWFF